MNDYFKSLSNYNGWLLEKPTKRGALANAKTAGNAVILNGSYNKALIINAPDGIYLQSYDTLILKVDDNGKIEKLWNGYSKTTLNHINTFLNAFGVPALNKKAWENFTGVNAL